MRDLTCISTTLSLLFSLTTGISEEAPNFRTCSMDEVLMRRVDDYCMKAGFKLNDSRYYFTKEDLIERLTPLFPDVEFSSFEDGKDVHIVEGLFSHGAEKNAAISIVVAKNSEKARHALLRNLVMCSAPTEVLLYLYEASVEIGDFCFAKKMSSESARRVGETLYFARGNVGFKIWSSDGEIDIECVARQVDSMLTSTPTTYCSDTNWPTNVYVHSKEP